MGLMVCTAAPIPATQLPTSCDIACDGAGASGRKSARAGKSYSGSGRGFLFHSKATVHPYGSTHECRYLTPFPPKTTCSPYEFQLDAPYAFASLSYARVSAFLLSCCAPHRCYPSSWLNAIPFFLLFFHYRRVSHSPSSLALILFRTKCFSKKSVASLLSLRPSLSRKRTTRRFAIPPQDILP
jgi:hypothetical protein